MVKSINERWKAKAKRKRIYKHIKLYSLIIEKLSLMREPLSLLMMHGTIFVAFNTRVMVSISEKKLRHTKAAMKAAQTTYEDELPSEHEIELQPEDEVLQKTLADERKALLKELDGRAVKTVRQLPIVSSATLMTPEQFLVTLTGIAGRIQRDQDPEKTLLKEAISRLRKLINNQSSSVRLVRSMQLMFHVVKSLAILEADLALFRKAFNQRVLYFRQLQEISDSVAELVLEKPLDETMEECKTEQTELDAKINANKARQRYLDHIAQDAMDEDDDEGCILCKCEFIRGFITQWWVCR